jgi:hypothetical protein
MDVAEVLRDILVVLIAAKAAAELAERLGIPAVVGEIVAGILVGPSVLGFVDGHDEVLRTLGEIGVILLLLEVGLEMDIRELANVGRGSMLVATVGVVCPLVLGFGATSALGEDVNTALFVGAALTATSVGITARVFGDLRALATTEARLVLGAAVVDDATVARWPDGAVVQSFTLAGARRSTRFDPEQLRAAMVASLRDGGTPTWSPAPDAEVDFDGAASPWHTVGEVHGADRPALLHDVAAALAAAGVEVAAAGVHVDDGLVIDRFELVTRSGAKLSPQDEEQVRRLLHDGPPATPKAVTWLPGRLRALAGTTRDGG